LRTHVTTLPVPVRIHGNLGFIIDGTGDLIPQRTLTAEEEFALGVNKYNRITFGLGVEVPLPTVTPYIEYTLGVPVGIASTGLVGPDALPVSVTSVMPQKL